MIYTEMTIKAMQIAYKAHAGQVDYSNVPYVFHPYHLAEQMDDEISCTVALLHDVVEDTDVTIEDLEREFPEAVTEVIKLLTHEKDVNYFDYVSEYVHNLLVFCKCHQTVFFVLLLCYQQFQMKYSNLFYIVYKGFLQ